MCELFGMSSCKSVLVNDYLKEFISHSNEHPNGWGIAQFYGNAVSLEKEPITANKSVYLKERLRHRFEAKNMMAHIRLATKGDVSYENCHPFVMRDTTDRVWTLIHNGTIFDCQVLEPYYYTQEGRTDSERILCHIISAINHKIDELKRELTDRERFDVVNQVVLEITPNNNKVNLLIFDNTQFYAHTNMKNTLYRKQACGTTFFSTVPLDNNGWDPVPLMQLVSYVDGELLYTATVHDNEYIYDENQIKYLFLESSAL